MKKWLKWTLAIIALALLIFSSPEIFHRNKGESRALGTVGSGSLENAYLLPYRGQNFKYFSPVSYFLLDNAYVHARVHRTLLSAYKNLEQTCPDTFFRIMECAHKGGGKMLIHRTHQNGLSVDFMIPKKKNGRQSLLYDRLGIWHYLLEFTDAGILKLDKKVEIDFETMARHILALDDAARTNGLRIQKVILKLELKDDFFKTKSGKKVKSRGIYFARSLPPNVNAVHDDHYHIDFEIVR